MIISHLIRFFAKSVLSGFRFILFLGTVRFLFLSVVICWSKPPAITIPILTAESFRIRVRVLNSWKKKNPQSLRWQNFLWTISIIQELSGKRRHYKKITNIPDTGVARNRVFNQSWTLAERKHFYPHHMLPHTAHLATNSALQLEFFKTNILSPVGVLP